MNFLVTRNGLVSLKGFDPSDKDYENLYLQDGTKLFVPKDRELTVLRTSYQKIYLPESKRYDPPSHIDDNVIKRYLYSKVQKEENTHPVGSVFDLSVYVNNVKQENFPGWSMLNRKLPNMQQDKFDNLEGFLRPFNVSLKGMRAFGFFKRYSVDLEDYIRSVTKAYKVDECQYKHTVKNLVNGKQFVRTF